MATSGQRGGGKGSGTSRGSGKKETFRPLKDRPRKIEKGIGSSRGRTTLTEDSLAGVEDTGGRNED